MCAWLIAWLAIVAPAAAQLVDPPTRMDASGPPLTAAPPAGFAPTPGVPVTNNPGSPYAPAPNAYGPPGTFTYGSPSRGEIVPAPVPAVVPASVTTTQPSFVAPPLAAVAPVFSVPRLPRFFGPWEDTRFRLSQAWADPALTTEHNYGAYLYSGYDSFRGISDGTYNDNSGFTYGANLGVPIPGLRRFGVGGQLGGTYGLYDLNGRASMPGNQDVQQQFLFTGGFFRRPTEPVPIGIGFVYDGMVNNAYGVFAQSPYFSQWRGQLSVAFTEYMEVGAWFTLRDHGGSRNVNNLDINYRAINQLNFFFHGQYPESGADSWVYIGIPERDRLAGGGSLGELLMGALFNVPLTDSLELYANTVYMKPSADRSFLGSIEGAWNVSFGVAYYPGRMARTPNVGGRQWMPFLPPAGNSNFLIDTNRTF